MLLLGLCLTCCTAKGQQSQLSSPSAPSPSSQQSASSQQESSLCFAEEEVTVSAGGSAQLEVLGKEGELLSFLSDDPQTLYVNQKGEVTGFKEGSAQIRVRSASGATASCRVKVEGRVDDPYESLRLKEEDRLSYTYFYGTGISFTDKNETIFTPSIWEVDINELNHTGYAVYLRFSKLSEQTGQRIYTFPSVKLTPDINEQGSVFFLLQSDDFDCGFCPEAGGRYDIELVICAAQSGKVIAHGVFEDVGKVPDVVQYCKYYAPTPLPGLYDRVKDQSTVSYQTTTGGSVEGKALQILFNGEQSAPVTATPEQGYEFLMWSDGKTDPTRFDSAEGKNTAFTAYFLKKSAEKDEMPTMYIFTETGKPVVKKSYESATVIIRGSGSRETDITAATQIKGRGNSSWNGSADQASYDSKNSYRLKLDQKAQLLGIGDSENRDWVLNSNKFDLSGLRNYLVWELADRMGGFSYVPDCSFVRLYVNGQYRGMYMVTEFIEIAKDRVELEEFDAEGATAPEDKDYFLEVDFRGTEEGLPFFYVEGYGAASNGNQREFVIKNACNQNDKFYIQKYVQQCHDALVGGNKAEIEKLIDLPSFIDMYILEELSKDVDVGAASCYLQKKADGKLEFTAPWDYDFGFGTFEKAVKYENMISVKGGGCTWFSELLEEEWFRNAVLARMAELESDFDATLKAVDGKAEEIRAGADENALFWNMYGTRYHGYVDRQVSSELKSYEEHISFIKDWSTNRWSYMKSFIEGYGKDEV